MALFARLERSFERLLHTSFGRRSALCLGVALTVTLAQTLPLVADEAYYAWWASVPDLGYLDHPPAVMAWAWLSDELLWGPRAMGVLTQVGAGALLVSAMRQLQFKRASLLPLVGLLTPFGVALGVLLTPDVPLVFGWALTLWGWAVGAPIRAGLGGAVMLWSKSSALLPLGLLSLAWLIYTAHERRWAMLRSVTVMWSVTLVLYLPHIVWSSAHDWLPWSFQAGRSWGGRFGLLEWLLSQLWLISPLWAWWGVKSSLRALRERADGTEVARARRSLAFIGLGQLVFWSLVSVGMRVEGNWSALAWPPLLMLTLHDLGEEPSALGSRQMALPIASRGALWGALCCAPLCLAPLLLRLAPLSMGPPRSPDALLTQTQTCLAQHSAPTHSAPSHSAPSHSAPTHSAQVTHLIAGRYQEMALLWWATRSVPVAERPTLSYINGAGRRTSEFERRLGAQAPRCGYLYLGPPSWLAGACSGALKALHSPACVLTDKLTPTLCLCQGKETAPTQAVERPPH